MSLLSMSLSGGVLAALIALLRGALGKRLPRRTFLVLWGVALARLLLPLELPSPTSVYNVAPALKLRPAPALTAPAGMAFPAAGRGIDPLLLVWVLGLISCAGFFLVTWMRCRLEFREALPVEEDFPREWAAAQGLRRPVALRRSDRISAPLTYGLLRPVVLLPKGMEEAGEERMEYVLAHEFVHIRRWDGLWKLLLTAALCIHWFNPLVWLMYLLANRDLELSCDQAVVRRFGGAARQNYALALLTMEEARSSLRPLCNHFSKNAIEERIRSIMDWKDTTLLAGAAALVLVVGVVAAFATSAWTAPQTAAPAAVKNTALRGGRWTDVTYTNVVQTAENDWKEDPETGYYYTQAQYDRLAALKTEGYESQSIAQFNRSMWAAVNGEDQTSNELYEALWRVQDQLPAEDPLAPFVHYTLSASLREYSTRLDEVMSGRPKDPDFQGSATRTDYADVYGDQVQVGQTQLEYSFTYRILDQDGLTVADRDRFLTQITAGMQTFLDQWTGKRDDKELEKAALAELDRLGQAAGTSAISYQKGEMDWVWTDYYAF